MKRRGGKQSLVQLNDQKEAFTKYKDYFTKKNDLPTSDEIFTTISKELQCRMSEKALYISLKRNFTYFFGSDNLCEDSSNEITSQDESSRDCSNEADEESSNHKVFNFNLDAYKWQQIMGSNLP
jgi:hypothetical protein